MDAQKNEGFRLSRRDLLSIPLIAGATALGIKFLNEIRLREEGEGEYPNYESEPGPDRYVELNGLSQAQHPKLLYIMGYSDNPEQKIRITDPFNLSRVEGGPHNGIDIAYNVGDPYAAAQDGKVVYVGERAGGGPNSIILFHGQDSQGKYWYTQYLHGNEALVKVGDNVWSGQPIGKAGERGLADGPHLHFEVRRTSKPFVAGVSGGWTTEGSGEITAINPQSFTPYVIPEHPISIFTPESGPSLSTSKIDQILQRNNSPAVGLGAAFIRLSQKYGVDPAIPLAMFWQESNFGVKGYAAITKNPGNIRFRGKINPDPKLNSPVEYTQYVPPHAPGTIGYCQYASWEAGLEDLFFTLRVTYAHNWDKTSLERILEKYAPPGDGNNTQSYLNTCHGFIAKWRHEMVSG